MAYSSKTFKKNWEHGTRAENIFEKILCRFDKKSRKANREEQFRHIDFISSLGSFDVKAQKKVNRDDKTEQNDLIWIEFKNVSGNKGWLYGDSDFIAFERESDFLVIKRNYLKGMAEVLCEINQKVSKASDALYKGYTREGRKDLISIIRMEDLESLPHEIWKK
jgi:hypothetical protein